MRLGAVFSNALAAGPGAYTSGVTARLNEDSLRVKAEQEQAALTEMRRQQDEAARIRGVADVTAATENISAAPTFNVAGQRVSDVAQVPVAPVAPAAGLSMGPRYTPMGPATAVQQQVAEKIKAAATRQGLEPDIALRIATLESSMGSNTQGGGAAAGVFQFMPSTWNAMGGGDVNNPDLNIQRGVELTMQNHAALRKALGRQPTGAELYLAHQQGISGAKALLLNPGMKAVDALQKAGLSAAQAARHLSQNRIDPNMTAAQVNAHFQNVYNAAGGGVRQFLPSPAVNAGVSVPTADQMKSAFGKPGQVYMPAASAKSVPTADQMKASFGTPKQTGAKPAGIQPAAAAPSAETSLIEAAASQPVGAVDATGWKQILLDTPGKPGQELAAFTDARAELVRLAESFRQAKLSGQYLEVRAKIKEMDSTAMYLHGMQALQNFADGDPRYLQAVMSELVGGPVEIQPRSDGKLDVYRITNGKRVAWKSGATPADVETLARTRFDAEYNKSLAEIAKEQRGYQMDIAKEGAKSGFKINEIAAESRRDLIKLFAEGKVDEALERVRSELGANSKATVDTTTGTIIVQQGQQFTRIGTSTVKGPDGKDMQTLVSQDISGNVGGGGGGGFAWNSTQARTGG